MSISGIFAAQSAATQGIMGLAHGETTSAISSATGAAGGMGSMLGVGQLALTAGMGILNIFQQKAEQEKQQYMQQVQFAQNMSNRNWDTLNGSVQNLLKNIEISRVNQARFRQNRAIGRAANSYAAIARRQLNKEIGSQLVEVNQGFKTSLGKLTAFASGSNLSTGSGTYKALKEQLKSNAGATLTAIKTNEFNERQNIQRGFEGILAKRDLFSYNMPSYYVPSQAPQNVASPGNNFLDYATAGLSGAAQGLDMVNTIGEIEMAAGSPTMSTW